MVRPEIAHGLLIYLKENLGKLKTLASLHQEDFLRDFTKLESAKYLLQTSIQTCIDIANHVIASGTLNASPIISSKLLRRSWKNERIYARQPT